MKEAKKTTTKNTAEFSQKMTKDRKSEATSDPGWKVLQNKTPPSPNHRTESQNNVVDLKDSFIPSCRGRMLLLVVLSYRPETRWLTFLNVCVLSRSTPKATTRRLCSACVEETTDASLLQTPRMPLGPNISWSCSVCALWLSSGLVSWWETDRVSQSSSVWGIKMTKTPPAVCSVFCLSKEPHGGSREPRCVQRVSFINRSTESNLRDHIWKEINEGFDDRGDTAGN